MLCRHIPDRYEQLVRYVGWYSNRVRGERAKKGPGEGTPYSGALVPAKEPATRATAAWARLIRQVYEADPLTCPECHGPMRVVALIDDPRVVRRILEHLGRWAPTPAARGPPAQGVDWPPGALIPLSYHPDLPKARPDRLATGVRAQARARSGIDFPIRLAPQSISLTLRSPFWLGRGGFYFGFFVFFAPPASLQTHWQCPLDDLEPLALVQVCPASAKTC